MPGALLRQLARTIEVAGEDPGIRLVVLRASGTGAFCAGASFDELKSIRTLEEGKEFFSGFARVILAMIRCPKFVLARVHGRAAGGGGWRHSRCGTGCSVGSTAALGRRAACRSHVLPRARRSGGGSPPGRRARPSATQATPASSSRDG